MKYIFISLFGFLATQIASAQSASQILHELDKFEETTRVLYVAAHPDDENTRVISWLVNGVHAETAYLSLTRGDGGQNLIGKEFGPSLGILRTQELMAARHIDGGNQYFTRAVDFGYSRSATESFDKWGKEAILADVVWTIRKFRPQVIITRFPPDERAGHGHHTASAILAIEAFALAADKNAYPEQLQYVETWQAQSVYWNTSSWWDKQVVEDMKTDTTIWMADIGGYNPLLGSSYNELGSLARSQHKCQGFGVDIQRGESLEYFRHLAGAILPKGLASLQVPNWKNLGAPKVPELLAEVHKTFNPKHPEKSVQKLVAIYTLLDKLVDSPIKKEKKEQLAEIIVACSGVFAEAIAENYAYLPGQMAKVSVNLLSRSADDISIPYVASGPNRINFKQPQVLPKNTFLNFDMEIEMPSSATNPFWLAQPFGTMYDVPLQQIGVPINPPLAFAETDLLLYGEAIPLKIPVKYKWRERVEGELQRDINTVNPVFINFEEATYTALNASEITVAATLKWFAPSGEYMIDFKADGWEITTPQRVFAAKGFGAEARITLKLKPTKNATTATLTASFADGTPVRSFTEIAYSHIPTQMYMPVAETHLANLNLKITGKRVAYIAGAGDVVAQGIAQMGYAVDVLDQNALASADLSKYQAVVLGIRAYNTQEWLGNFADKMLKYVADGGNVIVQYNTASRFLDDKPLIPAPFPFDLGSGRVTEENATVTFELPEHKILKSPNPITKADFEDWVQERGLYFAKTWDAKYQTPLSWHDTGLEPEKGGLIIADYGKGAFMYTGISFFRQLPAGVPGAYRLLANLISY